MSKRETRPTPSARFHSLAVPRTARYLTLGEEKKPRTIWFLCHGYGQLAADFLEMAKALARPTALLVAPEALSRFYLDEHRKVGASWMTREDRLNEMEDYIAYLDIVHERVLAGTDRADARVAVLGFSQGVATAARWAARGKATNSVGHAVFWGSALPPELSLQTLGHIRVTLAGGSRDPFYGEDVRAGDRNRLTEAKVAFDELLFDGGHRLDDRTLEKLEA
jgi:predicted esterase